MELRQPYIIQSALTLLELGHDIPYEHPVMKRVSEREDYYDAIRLKNKSPKPGDYIFSPGDREEGIDFGLGYRLNTDELGEMTKNMKTVKGNTVGALDPRFGFKWVVPEGYTGPLQASNWKQFAPTTDKTIYQGLGTDDPYIEENLYLLGKEYDPTTLAQDYQELIFSSYMGLGDHDPDEDEEPHAVIDYYGNVLEKPQAEEPGEYELYFSSGSGGVAVMNYIDDIEGVGRIRTGTTHHIQQRFNFHSTNPSDTINVLKRYFDKQSETDLEDIASLYTLDEDPKLLLGGSQIHPKRN